MESAHAPLIDQAESALEVVQEAQAIIDAETRRLQGEVEAQIQAALGTDGESLHNSGLVDINVENKQPVPSPGIVEEALPVPAESEMARTTLLGRKAIGDILLGYDDRLIVITGPCSIHNAEEAIAYAEKVKQWRERYGDKLAIVMRAYFEKPRSEKGWKGLVYDPRLDETDAVALGLVLTRMIAMRITNMGVPLATERLNALTPQYLNALIAYDAIGARNTTDQKAREYASSTSSPVGFKNTPDGGLEDAVSAMVAARQKHSMLGLDEAGRVSHIRTTGNKYAHLILRGGKSGPNYAPRFVKKAKELIAKKSAETGEDLPQAVILDASHGNSGKVAANQSKVIRSVARQLAGSEQAIKGVMLESNLNAGIQPINDGKDLEYGVSVTDECIGIEDTELLLDGLAKAVAFRRKRAKALAS
jgi:3-deoxy-7-phosphoheptulonate synthase